MAENKKYKVVENKFKWAGSQTIELDLILKTRFMRKLLKAAREENLSEVEQFFYMLELIGDEKTLEQIDEMAISETGELVEAYFIEVEAAMGAAPGK